MRHRADAFVGMRKPRSASEHHARRPLRNVCICEPAPVGETPASPGDPAAGDELDDVIAMDDKRE
jgi:hypothetical protein